MITAITGVTAMSGITAISNPLSDITRIGAALSTTTTVPSYNMGSTGYLSSTFDSSTIGTGDISVSCWVKTPTAYDSVEYIWVLGNDDLTDSLALRVSTSKLQIIGQVGGGGVSGVTQWNPLLPDQWTHVVVTRTGTSINIYINGTNYYYSSHANFGADLSGGETWLGYQGGARSFNGDIANIEVRNAVLTASEIYNNFRSNTAYTTGTAQDLGISLNGDATESVSPIPLGWSNKHSFYFDGALDHLEADSFASAYASDTSGSFSVWVKFIDATPTADEAILSYSDTTRSNEWLTLRLKATTGYLQAIIRDNTEIKWNLLTDAQAFSDNTWHHVVFVQNGTSPVLYIDGTSPAQTINLNPDETAWFSSLTSPNTFNIARLKYSTGPNIVNYANMFLDELNYYSNTALSSSQVAALYNASTPANPSPAPDYYLHEGLGADWSGNNIAALLQSGATASSDVPVLTIPDWVLEHSLEFVKASSQYGIVKSNSAFSFPSAFSIDAWILWDDEGTGHQIIQKQSTSAGKWEWIFVISYSGQLGLYIYTNSSSNYISITSVDTIPTGAWTHVMVTHDGGISNTGMTLYINGIAASVTRGSGGSYTGVNGTDQDLWIGRSNTDYADGKRARMGVWSAELDADAALFLAQNPAHDLNTDSGDYDYSSDIVAAHAIETGFGPYVIDYSGNGHHATAPSGAAPTWSTDVPNLFRDIFSVDFDGVNDRMDIVGSQSAGTYDFLHNSKTFTVMGWFKLDDYTVSNSIALVGTNYTSSRIGFNFWIDLRDNGGAGTDHALRCNIDDGTNSTSVYQEGVISDNDWHHYAVTGDGTTLKLYIDGSVQSSTASLPAATSSSAAYDLRVGDRAGIGGAPFPGLIDEVAIFSSALSVGQISAIYNNGVPDDLTSYSSFNWWRMGDNDGGTGTTITDQGSGGNNGTLTNGPTFSTDTPS